MNQEVGSLGMLLGTFGFVALVNSAQGVIGIAQAT